MVMREIRTMGREAEKASQSVTVSDTIEQGYQKDHAHDAGRIDQAGDGGVDNSASGNGGALEAGGTAQAGGGDGGVGGDGSGSDQPGQSQPSNLGGDGPAAARPAAYADPAAEQSLVTPGSWTVQSLDFSEHGQGARMASLGVRA